MDEKLADSDRVLVCAIKLAQIVCQRAIKRKLAQLHQPGAKQAGDQGLCQGCEIVNGFESGRVRRLAHGLAQGFAKSDPIIFGNQINRRRKVAALDARR